MMGQNFIFNVSCSIIWLTNDICLDTIRFVEGSMSKTVDIKTMDDWELVCLFCWYGDPILTVLSKALQEEIDTCVWAIQDGYGESGYTPVQGWDWSGIRDSMPETKDRMVKMIRRILHREKITTIEIRDRKRVTA